MVATNVIWVALLSCVAVAAARVPGLLENQTQVSSENYVRDEAADIETTRSPRKKHLIEKIKRVVENEIQSEKNTSGSSGAGDTAKLRDLVNNTAIDSRELSPEDTVRGTSSPWSGENPAVLRSKKSNCYSPPQQLSIYGLPPPGASIEIRPPYASDGAVQPIVGQGSTAAATLSLTQPTAKAGSADGVQVLVNSPRSLHSIADGGQTLQTLYNGQQMWGPVLLACQPQPWAYAQQQGQGGCVMHMVAPDRRLPMFPGFKKSVPSGVGVGGDDGVKVNASVSDAVDAAVRQMAKEVGLELASAAADDQASLPWTAPPSPEEVRLQGEAMLRDQAVMRAQQQEAERQWKLVDRELQQLWKKAMDGVVPAGDGQGRSTSEMGQQLGGMAAQPQTIILGGGQAPFHTPYAMSSGAMMLGSPAAMSSPLQTRPVIIHHQASQPSLQPVITISTGHYA